MSEFKAIRGKAIKSLTSDPSPAVAGDIWYNSTSQTLKGAVYVSAWSAGGTLGTARYDLSGTGATQSAYVVAGGYSPSVSNLTEKYNGTSWSASNTMPAAVFAGAMFGTQTAAVYASGKLAPALTSTTSEYGGTSWTAGGAVTTARQQIAAQCGGTQTAGIIFGGYLGPPGGSAATEEYDGTSWTAQSGALNLARWNGMGTGTQTAAVMSGSDSPATSNVEEWNGTSWSEVNNMPLVRYKGMVAGNSQTDYNVIGGNTNPGAALSTTVINYDGTNWSSVPSIATARNTGAGSSQNATSQGIIAGGAAAPASNATEEFTQGNVTKTFTTS